jgi:hypothetical protein
VSGRTAAALLAALDEDGQQVVELK